MTSFYLKHKIALHYLMATLFGVVGVFAFAPFDQRLASFFSVAGLLFFGLNLTTRQSAWVGFFWGVGFFSAGIHWVYVSIREFGELPVPFSVALVALLVAYMSLYPALFNYLLHRIAPKNSLLKFVLLAPALWTLTEFLRGWVLTGFPWLQFGYIQADGPLRGIAPIFGVEAITFVIFLLGGLVAYSLKQQNLKLVILAVLVLISSRAIKETTWVTPVPERALSVAMVQGNIPQSLKWNPNTLQPTLDKYTKATDFYLNQAQLIIWPEAAIPDLERNQQPFLHALDEKLRNNQTQLITGIIDGSFSAQGFKAYNTIIALGNETPYQYQGENRYHKQHLVVFGEFVPFESLLRPLAKFFDLPMSSLSRGESQQPLLKAGDYQFTSAICYEIIMGQLVRENFRPESDFLLTISNDAWFGDSIGPWQHMQMARMRALELGRPLLRATNNGITTAINEKGIIIKQIPQFTHQVLNVVVTPTTGLTPFARWGYWPVWGLCSMIIVAYLLKAIRRRK